MSLLDAGEEHHYPLLRIARDAGSILYVQSWFTL